MAHEDDRVGGIDFDYENPNSCNKLLRAVINCDEKTVVKLLKENWSPNSTDNHGRTAMHLASKTAKHYKILKILLEYDGYPDHVTHNGTTALCLASYSGLNKSVKLLLDSGASVNKRNNIEATSLHFACNGPSKEVVRLLVEAGAQINATDFYLTSPLMLAVKNRNQDMVRYLLANGADIMLEDADQHISFHYACLNDDLEIFNLLLDSCDVSLIGDMSCNRGRTLLMFAAQSSAVKITDRLLGLGCDVTKENDKGLLALHLAAHNSPECFKLILDRTPVNVINEVCKYDIKRSCNSIPCLLIDKSYLESLKYLFGKSGIDNDVLICPVVSCASLCSPISFAFCCEAPLNFIVSAIQLYSDRNLHLDLIFPSTITNNGPTIMTCLDSFFKNLNPVDLNDREQSIILFNLLKNGANLDNSFNSPSRTDSHLWVFGNSGSILCLAYLLRYSDLLEPISILQSLIKMVLKNCDGFNCEEVIRSVQFLSKQCKPWDLVKYLNSELHPHIEGHDPLLKNQLQRIFECFNFEGDNFPSLRFLSRATLREYIHCKIANVDTFKKYSALNKKEVEGFRQTILNLPVPSSLLSFIQYDDLIASVQS